MQLLTDKKRLKSIREKCGEIIYKSQSFTDGNHFHTHLSQIGVTFCNCSLLSFSDSVKYYLKCFSSLLTASN